jgi:hypothetical protein
VPNAHICIKNTQDAPRCKLDQVMYGLNLLLEKVGTVGDPDRTVLEGVDGVLPYGVVLTSGWWSLGGLCTKSPL